MLWPALRLRIDPPPHVLEDEIGLRLAAPDDDWRPVRTDDLRPETSEGLLVATT